MVMVLVEPIPEGLKGWIAQYTPRLYAQISLKDHGTYVQPLDGLGVLEVEIQNAADCGDAEAEWTVKLVSMTPLQYDQLEEFAGH